MVYSLSSHPMVPMVSPWFTRVIFKNVLALPAVNGWRKFEAQKSASVHDKNAPLFSRD